MSGCQKEGLIKELCARNFLKGFVFHSPRYFDPTEKEAGDVVLWVRRQIIVVEVVSREEGSDPKTSKFIRRIGEKREQLVRDYAAFHSEDIEVRMTNVAGDEVPFDKTDLAACLQFAGVVLVDCD